MQQQRLAVVAMAVVSLLLPLEALATLCLVDTSGGRYSIEVGPATGSKISLYGYFKGPDDCLLDLGGIAPLVGDAVLIDSSKAVVGWQVHSIDLTRGCVAFRERYTVNLNTAVFTGDFFNDAGTFGSDTLTLSACPSPAAVGTPALGPSPKEKAH